ncbi:MAG: N-acyl homoserine lactonase family protein [Thermaerobacter sp.]|nr:N-acyl homoserine lactonase family protein [Thermaerobacter sp.]
MLQEISLLHAGNCLIDQSELVTGSEEGTLVRVPIWMYLLRTDDALLLVDSGMPTECIGNERYFSGEQDGDHILPQMQADDAVARVLARQGYSIGDLDALISTHWHFDHAGGNRLFHGKPVLVHPAELEQARTETALPVWVDLSLDFRPVADGDQPAAGITLLHTPGHTPGHLSLLLHPSGERPIMLTIDAAYTARNWMENLPGAMVDPALGMRSVSRLQALAREESAVVFFGHDAAQAQEPLWQKLAR